MYKSYSMLKNKILKEDNTNVLALKDVSAGRNKSHRIITIESLANILDDSFNNGQSPPHLDFVYGLRIIAQQVGEQGFGRYGSFGINVIKPLAETYNSRTDRGDKITSFNAAVAGEIEPNYKLVEIFKEDD